MSEGNATEVAPQKRKDRTADAAQEILAGTSGKGRLARLLPFLGPAFIASVAYVDPGNFATNIQGGARFGYTLLWVIVASNLMAMLIQAISAKLGIATGLNLAEQCRANFPRPVVLTHVGVDGTGGHGHRSGGVPGGSAGVQPLVWHPSVAGGADYGRGNHVDFGAGALWVSTAGGRDPVLVGVVAFSYVVETFLDRPDLGSVLFHSVVPQFQGAESVVLAAGILGATVMPHAIFLHSALTQNRIVVKDPDQQRRLFGFEIADVLIAMTVAGFVNAAMLIMAAATFFNQGLTNIGTIEEAHRTLEPLLGSAASWVFAISLLASGLSSSSVGTMAGQVIMQGFLHWHIPVWIRRIVTFLPSLVVIMLKLDPTSILVLSQVVLSFGLPFAVIPLLLFTSRRDIMGVLTNSRITNVLLTIVAALIIALNLFLLYQTFLRRVGGPTSHDVPASARSPRWFPSSRVGAACRRLSCPPVRRPGDARASYRA